MLRIAAGLGFSETAFLTGITSDSARIRYFSPRDEIAFCGHATIASESPSLAVAPGPSSRSRPAREWCRSTSPRTRPH
jgi:PhzF family phenazine biosynthesis protein